jgi:integrase
MASIKAKIGIRELTALQPQTILWDTVIPGFNARKQFSDVITFSIIYRSATGIQRWHRIGRLGVWTPDQARQEARRIRMTVDVGKDPAGEKYAFRTGPTIAELLDDYLVDLAAHKLNGKKATTIKSDKSRIENHIRPKLGKYRVVAITQSQIEQFMNQCSPGSARTIVALLSSVFSFAVRKGLRSDNPCKLVKKPANVHKTRRLSEAEYQQLGTVLHSDSINPTASAVVKMLLVTGWRSGEVIRLKWDALDIDRRIVTLADTKSGTSIRPLSGAAIEIIKVQKRTSEYVFGPHGRTIGNMNQSFIRLGMSKEVTPHVLRHSFASLAADMGLADHMIAGLLGHARSSITSRYIHVERSLIEASDLVADATMKLMRS